MAALSREKKAPCSRTMPPNTRTEIVKTVVPATALEVSYVMRNVFCMPECQALLNDAAERLDEHDIQLSPSELFWPEGAAQAISYNVNDRLYQEGWSLLDRGERIRGLLYILYVEFVESSFAAEWHELDNHPDFADYLPHAILEIESLRRCSRDLQAGATELANWLDVPDVGAGRVSDGIWERDRALGSGKVRLRPISLMAAQYPVA